MKMQVIGFEINQGISNKTGKPYAIGKLHTIIPISSSNPDTKGAIGQSYDCDVSVMDKIKSMNPPMLCEVEISQVFKYGKAQNQIMSVVPVSKGGNT